MGQLMQESTAVVVACLRHVSQQLGSTKCSLEIFALHTLSWQYHSVAARAEDREEWEIEKGQGTQSRGVLANMSIAARPLLGFNWDREGRFLKRGSANFEVDQYQ